MSMFGAPQPSPLGRLRDLYLNTPMPHGSLKAYHPTLGEKAETGLSNMLGRLGVGTRQANRLAGKTLGALTALTPVGSATSASDAGRDYSQGNYLGAAGNALSALLGLVPDGGAATAKGLGAVLHSIIAPLYHGSPHKFEKFALEKIGTGEGAQAYGHGLYFAENPEVATGYRDRLTEGGGQSLNFGGRTITSADGIETLNPKELAAVITAQHGGNVAEAAKNTADLIPYMSGYPKEARTAALNELQKNPKRYEGTSWTTGGHLYEVSLNANPEDFLNWDAPLSSQPSGVLNGLSSAGLFKGAKPETLARMDQPGSFAYHNMIATRGGSYAGPRAVAPALSQNGIPGIRYLDQGSRTAGQGTHNYVVFDPSIIDILGRR